MENKTNITFSELLDDINSNSNILCNHFDKLNIIIDKEYYILNFNHICILSIYFDFNLIKFDIKINTLLEYTTLLNLYDDDVNQKLENYNINNLQIDSIDCYDDDDDDLYIIKHLESKNFNFELLPLKIVLYYFNNTLQYIIDNNLYNFLSKDKYQIIKYCNSKNFKFFISYLNFNVYDDYDGYTFYKFIDTYSNKDIYYNDYISQIFEILYKDYKLLLNEHDILNSSSKIIFYIISYYDINDIKKYDEKIIYHILINNIFNYLCSKNNNYKNNYLKILENLINTLDINFLITLVKYESSFDIDEYIFKIIINKINTHITKLIDNLKINLKIEDLFKFYYLYHQHYDNSIINYKNAIFSDDDIEILKGDMIKIYNIIKYHFEE